MGDDGAWHDRAQQLSACGVFQRFQAAAQGVDQAVAGGLVGQAAADFIVQYVVGDIDQDLVGLGTDVGDRGRHIGTSPECVQAARGLRGAGNGVGRPMVFTCACRAARTSGLPDPRSWRWGG